MLRWMLLKRFWFWSIWIGGKKICKEFSSTIYEISHAAEVRGYWLSKERITQEGYNVTNWDALKIMEESPCSRRIFMTKHSVGMCGVGKFMHRWKEWDSPNCPRCRQFEDAAHVWTCTGSEANSTWKESLDNLSDWLTSAQTDPDIHDAIISYLNG
jgi:hypothetical protein